MSYMQYEGTLSSVIRGTSLFADFNLEYYTEAQISYLENSRSAP